MVDTMLLRDLSVDIETVFLIAAGGAVTIRNTCVVSQRGRKPDIVVPAGALNAESRSSLQPANFYCFNHPCFYIF